MLSANTYVGRTRVWIVQWAHDSNKSNNKSTTRGRAQRETTFTPTCRPPPQAAISQLGYAHCNTPCEAENHDRPPALLVHPPGPDGKYNVTCSSSCSNSTKIERRAEIARAFKPGALKLNNRTQRTRRERSIHTRGHVCHP